MHRLILATFLGLLIALTLNAPSACANDCKTNVGYRVMQIQGHTVAIWYPTSASPALYHYVSNFSGLVAHNASAASACGGPVPLVVFSHGDLGCGTQSISFTEELARHGYVVAAPDHADAALCHSAPVTKATRRPQPAQPPILKPEAWNDSSRVDRREDIEIVIDYLLASNEFGPIIDAQKIGLAGHSLGGYTVVAMSGAWQSWLDHRIRAVLALSPYVMPFQVKNTLGNVHIPLMYQGGTVDVGITPFLEGSKGAYSAANSPVYFVTLKNAGHFSWVNCGKQSTTGGCLEHVTNAHLIDEYGIAFFDRYLKGLPAPILDQKNQSLAAYEFR